MPIRLLDTLLLISFYYLSIANAKGGFFSESAIRFSNLPISKKKIFKKTILNLKFEILAHNITLLWAEILNFKFRIVFLNIFFGEVWRFEKRIALSEKSHL